MSVAKDAKVSYRRMERANQGGDVRKHRDTVARGRYAFAGGAFLMMVFGVLAGVAGGGWFLWNPETPRWILWVCGGCLVGSALGGLIVLATAPGGDLSFVSSFLVYGESQFGEAWGEKVFWERQDSDRLFALISGEPFELPILSGECAAQGREAIGGALELFVSGCVPRWPIEFSRGLH